MSRKQATIKAFCFTKSVSHRGKLTEVDIPKFAEEKFLPSKQCNKRFKNTQGLSVHMKCAHGFVEKVCEKHSMELQLSERNNKKHTVVVNYQENSSEDSNKLNGTASQSVPRCTNDVLTASTASQLVEESIIIDDEGSSKPKRRRICHDVTFKAEVIEAKESGLSVKEVIRKYRSINVDKTKISKWTKNKTEIFKAAADTETKRLLKSGPAKKYADLYRELKNQFSKAPQAGHTVDFNWLWIKGQKIYRIQQNNPDAELKKHVIANFIKKNHLK